MYVRERQQLILHALAEHGRVTVAQLAESLEVSAETIRRDLAALETEGYLERTHGGAVPVTPGGRRERGLGARNFENIEAKETIARIALDLLPASGGSIIVDAGTTTARLAASFEQAGATTSLSIITDSAPIAAELAAAGATDLHLLGGHLRGLTGACVGHRALEVLQQVRCDVAFIGTNGIEPERGLTTPDSEEAAVKRALCAAARRVVVLCDSSKFGLDHLVSFADLEDLDVLVTDRRPAADLLRALNSAGIEVLHP